MMEIVCNFSDRLALIETNYPGDCEIQMPVWLSIDWEREEIDAYTRNYRIGGIPMREYHGLASVYRLPGNMDATKIREWIINDLLQKIEEVQEKFSSEWNGHNWVGSFPEGVYEEFVEWIERECQDVGGYYRLDNAGVWEVSDWINTLPDGLTVDSSLDEIRTAAVALEGEAESENIVLRGDVVEHLLWLIRQKKEE